MGLAQGKSRRHPGLLRLRTVVRIWPVIRYTSQAFLTLIASVSGYGQPPSGYTSPHLQSPRGSLTGASGTLPRSRSPSAPHTSLRPSHSAGPSRSTIVVLLITSLLDSSCLKCLNSNLGNFFSTSISRSFELGPGRENSASRLYNGRNGPSPLLKDGTQPGLYDSPGVNRNTASPKVSFNSHYQSFYLKNRQNLQHKTLCWSKLFHLPILQLNTLL